MRSGDTPRHTSDISLKFTPGKKKKMGLKIEIMGSATIYQIVFILLRPHWNTVWRPGTCRTSCGRVIKRIKKIKKVQNQVL